MGGAVLAEGRAAERDDPVADGHGLRRGQVGRHGEGGGGDGIFDNIVMDDDDTTSSLVIPSTTRTTFTKEDIQDVMVEDAGVELFVRRSKPMRLSPAGERLLRLAEKVLPEVMACMAGLIAMI